MRARIQEIKMGEMIYYSPQVEKRFFWIKYWTGIVVYLNSGSVFHYDDNLSRNHFYAKEQLESYEKITGIKLEIIN